MIPNISAESITIEHLRALVDGNIQENRTLEYKKAMYEKGERANHEFCRDITALANTNGGHILIGIDNSNPKNIQFSPMEEINIDETTQRLMNTIVSLIEPSIYGVTTNSIAVDGGYVIVIHVPESWNRPHAVRIETKYQFYLRNSSGKYPIDIPDLRRLFLESETGASRITAFREKRITEVLSGKVPLYREDRLKTILHIVPLRTLERNVLFRSLNLFPQGEISLLTRRQPIPRPNMEGILYSAKSTPGFGDDRVYGTYLQVFRDGSMEFGDELLTKFEHRYILTLNHEKAIINSTRYAIDQMQKMSIAPPYIVMLSLVGAKGYELKKEGTDLDGQFHPPTIDRDYLFFEDVRIDDISVDVGRELRPIFDQLWNAAGRTECINYDSNGLHL